MALRVMSGPLERCGVELRIPRLCIGAPVDQQSNHVELAGYGGKVQRRPAVDSSCLTPGTKPDATPVDAHRPGPPGRRQICHAGARRPVTPILRCEAADVRPLRYSINVTLDGCCDHEAFAPDAELHAHFAAQLDRADALLFGRVIYQMMEEAWRQQAPGVWPDWMDEWMIPFAETIDGAKKYVVSSTLDQVDWNAELVHGDLEGAVRQLKEQPGRGLHLGGVTLALALADLRLIDEYEIVVHPVVAGHGPWLLAGLRERLELELVGRQEFRSGSVALTYQPRRATPAA